MSLLLLFQGVGAGTTPSGSLGTGGWGARLNASVAPLSSRTSSKRKHHESKDEDRRRHSLEVLEAAIAVAYGKVDDVPAAVEAVQASPAASVTEAKTITFPDLGPEIREIESRILEAKLLLAKLEEIERDEDDIEVLLLQ